MLLEIRNILRNIPCMFSSREMSKYASSKRQSKKKVRKFQTVQVVQVRDRLDSSATTLIPMYISIFLLF